MEGRGKHGARAAGPAGDKSADRSLHKKRMDVDADEDTNNITNYTDICNFDVDPESVPDDVDVLIRSRKCQLWMRITILLEGIMYHVPLEFEHNKIKMVKTDPGRVCLLDLEIIPELCIVRRPTVVGLDLVVFSKLIRSLSNSGGSILEFKILKSKPDEMEIRLFHPDKRVEVSSTIVLLDIEHEKVIIPQRNYSRVVTLPSSDFQRYTKELSTISRKINIYTEDGVLFMQARGDQGSSTIKLIPNPSGMHWLLNDNAAKRIGGVFPSRFLERFAKPLDTSVNLFLEEGLPLVIRYMTEFSSVRLVIAPFEMNEEDS